MLTLFDDFNAWDGFPREQHGRRWRASAVTSLDTGSGELTVEAKDHGGEVVFTGHADDDYIAQVDINRNSGPDGWLYFRYLDPDNWYRAGLVPTFPTMPPSVGVKVEKMLHGQLSTVASAAHPDGTWRTVKVKCAGSTIKVWVEGTLEINTTDSDLPWGAVGLSGWQAKFKNLKAGYDKNADDDIDYVVLNEAFNGTSVSPTYDHNGNLTTDADYAYTYDAWNNLVKVAAQNAPTNVTVAQYKFFGDDRRASKAVTNRGELDATTYFFYDGPEIVEERDADEDLVQQYIYGPNHIDELVMICGTNGTYFVYSDANWNVIGLTTPGGVLAEEYNYTPYGRLIAKRHTAFGDGDSDGDVDSTDRTAFNNAYGTSEGYPGWDRDFDADYDGDVDSFDQTAFNKNYNAAGTSVEVSGRAWSPNGNDYTYTARRLDPETGLMHYRWRTYSPTLKQFTQRDPLHYLDGPNLYQYVVGNPLRYVDPFGLLDPEGATFAGYVLYTAADYKQVRDAIQEMLEEETDDESITDKELLAIATEIANEMGLNEAKKLKAAQAVQNDPKAKAKAKAKATAKIAKIRSAIEKRIRKRAKKNAKKKDKRLQDLLDKYDKAKKKEEENRKKKCP